MREPALHRQRRRVLHGLQHERRLHVHDDRQREHLLHQEFGVGVEVGNEQQKARDQLSRDVGSLIVAGASKLLEREIDPQAHAQLLEQLAADIART